MVFCPDALKADSGSNDLKPRRIDVEIILVKFFGLFR